MLVDSEKEKVRFKEQTFKPHTISSVVSHHFPKNSRRVIFGRVSTTGKLRHCYENTGGSRALAECQKVERRGKAAWFRMNELQTPQHLVY